MLAVMKADECVHRYTALTGITARSVTDYHTLIPLEISNLFAHSELSRDVRIRLCVQVPVRICVSSFLGGGAP